MFRRLLVKVVQPLSVAVRAKGVSPFTAFMKYAHKQPNVKACKLDFGKRARAITAMWKELSPARKATYAKIAKTMKHKPYNMDPNRKKKTPNKYARFTKVYFKAHKHDLMKVNLKKRGEMLAQAWRELNTPKVKPMAKKL